MVIVIEVREPWTAGFVDWIGRSMEMIEVCVNDTGVIVIRSAMDVLKRRQSESHQQCDTRLQSGDPAHEGSVYTSRPGHSIFAAGAAGRR
jgi:hypothetical protein